MEGENHKIVRNRGLHLNQDKMAVTTDAHLPNRTGWLLEIKTAKSTQMCRVTAGIKTYSPGWCGSVDRMPACKPSGCWFDFQSGTCLGCRPASQLGACERQPINVSLAHPCFSPFSPSCPLSLKINKLIKDL